MELHLSADKEAQLARIAAEYGRDATALDQEILGNGLEAETKFIEAVKLGEADFENGNYVTQEEVSEWVKGLAKNNAG